MYMPLVRLSSRFFPPVPMMRDILFQRLHNLFQYSLVIASFASPLPVLHQDNMLKYLLEFTAFVYRVCTIAGPQIGVYYLQ
jgi:hypothetical protein